MSTLYAVECGSVYMGSGSVEGHSTRRPVPEPKRRGAGTPLSRCSAVRVRVGLGARG